MDERSARDLLDGVRTGAIPADDALEQLRRLPFLALADATVDTHRELRTGFPEVVYGAGKSDEQICRIADALRAEGHVVLVTRVEPAERLQRIAGRYAGARISERGRAFRLGEPASRAPGAVTLVVAAGTSDLEVAEEARFTLESLGLEARLISDVGVAGVHRLLSHEQALREAAAVIVVAGMDGALPSVVAGLVGAPVVAVPTSVGYGSAFEGLSALLAMLNSCAPGLSVVNIDNGFGAAMAVGRILTAPVRRAAEST